MHSLTLDSPLFDDGPLLDALARLRDSGVAVGFSTSGPGQAETILRAMELTRAGGPAVLRRAVDLEPAGDQRRARHCAAASRRELTVIVKEALANGRLVTEPPPALLAIAEQHGAAPDAVALAAAAAQPWVDRVLLGPAGVEQLAQNLLAGEICARTTTDLAALTGRSGGPGASTGAPVRVALAVTLGPRSATDQSSAARSCW